VAVCAVCPSPSPLSEQREVHANHSGRAQQPEGAVDLLFNSMEAIFGTDKTKKPGFSTQSATIRMRADTKIPFLLVNGNGVESPGACGSWRNWGDALEVPYTDKTANRFFRPPQTLKWGAKGVKGTTRMPLRPTSGGWSTFGAVKASVAGKKVALLSDGHCFCLWFLRLRPAVP